jgi:hypothetical protein
MKYIPILFILFACEDNAPQPDYQNSCIYRIVRSTNGQDVGSGGREFVRCDEDPNYRVSDPVNYVIEPCNCN